jgi:hypothetical protein
MTNKKNDNSIYYKDWTKKKLINEYKGYCEQIDNIGCFGTRDLISRDNIESEIERRGYEIYTQTLVK